MTAAIAGAPSTSATPSASVEGALLRLAALAAALDAAPQHDDAASLAERVAASQFYVACVGQFKRGKSTLIDALLGDAVLPRGIVPVTAVPTVVRYGPHREARVQLRPSAGAPHGAWRTIPVEEVGEFVSEEHNPANAKLVAAVEVLEPCALLASGMCLVDTPGLGSVYTTNTEATKAFIPQIDAALVVLGADPPISGDELDLIARVAQDVERLVLVLNKADRVSAEERRVASAFAREAIERRIQRAVPPLLEVCATERLAGEGPPRDWPRLVETLERLAEGSGRSLAAEAGRRGIARVARQLLGHVAVQRAALERPQAETAQWMANLERAVGLAGRALDDLGYLFTAEQERLARRFANERRQLLTTAVARGRTALGERLARVHGAWGPSLRRRMMHVAQDIARHELAAWLPQQQQLANTSFEEAMLRFTSEVELLFQRLASSGAKELEDMGTGTNLERHLTTPSLFFFKDLIRIAEPASPLRYAADVVLGAARVRRPFEIDAQDLLDWLLEMNSSRVEHDVLERIAAGRRELEGRVRSALRDASGRARQVLVRADALRDAGREAVRMELERLLLLEQEIRQVAQGVAV